MWPSLAMHNLNSTDVIPMWSTHTANPNDIICSVHDIHMQVSQASLHNIDCFTFSGINLPKCKLEHAHDGSHCLTQWEHGGLQ